MGLHNVDEDTWGKTLDPVEMIRLNPKVLELLEHNNPNINSIYVDWYDYEYNDNNMIDWDYAGGLVGRAKKIKDFCLTVTCIEYINFKFLTGLAQNRSIERLKLRCDCPRTVGAVFAALLPLFERNIRMRCLSINLPEAIDEDEHEDNYIFDFHDRESVIKAIKASKSLKCIELFLICDHEIFHTICTHLDLHQLTIKRANFDDEDAVNGTKICTTLKNMLCDQKCTLRYLELTEIDMNTSQASLITRGLAQNSSLQSLSFTYDLYFPWQALVNFHSVSEPLLTIESLHLGCCPLMEEVSSNFVVMLQNITNLKSLNLDYAIGETKDWKNIFRVALSQLPLLQNLSLVAADFSDGSLEVLAKFMNQNSSLKELNLSNNDTVTSSGWCNFFLALQWSEIGLEDINLGRNRGIDDVVLLLLAKVLETNTTLKAIEIDTISEEYRGMRSLLQILPRTQLEKISLTCSPSNDEWLVISSSMTIVRLKMLHTQLNCDHLKLLSNFIRDPRCVLEDLGLINHEHLLESQFITALSCNCTVKTLRIQWPLVTEDNYDQIVRIQQMFILTICGSALGSYAQYNSNHTLECLSLDAECLQISVQCGLLDLLLLNRNENKSVVARQKLLFLYFYDKSHRYDCFERWDSRMDLKLYPHFMSWIGKEMTELTMMYMLLQGRPSLLNGRNYLNSFDQTILPYERKAKVNGLANSNL